MADRTLLQEDPAAALGLHHCLDVPDKASSCSEVLHKSTDNLTIQLLYVSICIRPQSHRNADDRVSCHQDGSRVGMHRHASGLSGIGRTRVSDAVRVGHGQPCRATMTER